MGMLREQVDKYENVNADDTKISGVERADGLTRFVRIKLQSPFLYSCYSAELALGARTSLYELNSRKAAFLVR